MSRCQTLLRTSLRSNRPTASPLLTLPQGQGIYLLYIIIEIDFVFLLLYECEYECGVGLRIVPYRVGSSSRPYHHHYHAAASASAASNEALLPIQPKVEDLLSKPDDVVRLMKMERRHDDSINGAHHWFPYLDNFRCGADASLTLTSAEVLEALSPHILDVRKDKFRNVVRNRTYSLCLVVEGLCDLGNVSATFRSADALGFQSVHVVSCDSKRCNHN